MNLSASSAGVVGVLVVVGVVVAVVVVLAPSTAVAFMPVCSEYAGNLISNSVTKLASNVSFVNETLFSCTTSAPGRGCARGVVLPLSSASAVEFDFRLGASATPLAVDDVVDTLVARANTTVGPLFLVLELDGSGPAVVDGDGSALGAALDAALLGNRSRADFFTPADLMGGRTTPLAPIENLELLAQIAGGWPTVATLSAHVVCVLSGDDDARKAAYASTDAHARLCFADVDDRLDADGHRVFVRTSAASTDREALTRLVMNDAVKSVHLLHVRGASTHQRFYEAVTR